ncbi:MAG: cell division protein FtsH, partial [Campylobacter curvus]
SMLHERYSAVLEALEIYSGAIESMVSALYEEETIEGKRVREIIKAYEEQNGLETRLVSNDEHSEFDGHAKQGQKED